MRLNHVSLILGAAAVLIASLGWWRSLPANRMTVSAQDSAAAVIHRLGPPKPQRSPEGPGIDARSAFLRMHEKELASTFDVASVTLGESTGVGLVRYSIGHAVFHDVRWLRRVGNTWYPADPPAAAIQDSASDSLARVAEHWLKEGAPRWW